METVTEVVKNMAGGDGEVTIKRILGEKELNGKCGLYAQVTIQPGSSLGYHEHKNESETYYILSGTAEYNDNGTTRTVKAGDVTYTPDGKSFEKLEMRLQNRCDDLTVHWIMCQRSIFVIISST